MIAVVALALAAGAAAFDPVAFFQGRTRGEGTLKVMLQSPKRMSVDSEGRIDDDGTLLLTQRVQEAGKPPRIRHWRLKRTGPTSFIGTLTDAAGPVAVELLGNGARIRYRMKNNMSAEQWLTPAGADLVRNIMKVRRFGIVVAHFEESIRKLD